MSFPRARTMASSGGPSVATAKGKAPTTGKNQGVPESKNTATSRRSGGAKGKAR